MSARIFSIRCPHLDLLRRDLIEAYRSLEDRDVFVSAHNPHAPPSQVSMIHQAMVKHRQSCPICNIAPVKSDRTDLTIH